MTLKATSSCLALATLCLAGCNADVASDATSGIGYVEADWTYIAAPQNGTLVGVSVEEGARISAGQALFTLDTRDEVAALAAAEARLAQLESEARDTQTGARDPEIRALQAEVADARAALRQAERERERLLPLIEQGLEPANRMISLDAAVERAQARLSAAREQVAVARQPGRTDQQDARLAAVETALSQVDSARLVLEERQVSAQANGLVEEVFGRTGEHLNAGQPVLAIRETDGIKIRFYVPQAQLPAIDIGTIVRVAADGLNTFVQAEVTHIASEAEFTPPVIYSQETRDKLVFLVEAEPGRVDGLRPGLPVDVDW
ncbi:HlyD family efflux transporter periplasmic adaptor subunit [uncultured Algimonas sp.]|uniref:HlyD family secretion protein n=1 Tax=uncultured Algimonas sp. TaxID=1547920 RepID=UPI00262014E5|nr:HlyD family efflux transporter periplasmic adaptor subunit [uncultured Algimonas sp.]